MDLFKSQSLERTGAVGLGGPLAALAAGPHCHFHTPSTETSKAVMKICPGCLITGAQ